MEGPGRKWLPHDPPLSVDTGKSDFFITICASNRSAAPLLAGQVPEMLLQAIRFYHAERKWWVHVAVVMPDHVHIAARFAGKMVNMVQSWKRWTTREAGVIWQSDFFDHRLRNDESLREKADYLLMNPVRAGLVTRWEDWPHHWIGE